MIRNHNKVRAGTAAEVSCIGKVPFSSFTLANAVTKRRREQHRSAYHCTHCQQWHIGTDNGQRARGRHDRNS